MNIKLIPYSQNSDSDIFTTFKIILIGDSDSGKSSLLKRALLDKFDENYQATIGIGIFFMYFYVNDLKIRIKIVDSSGQEKYRSLTKRFYRNILFLILLFKTFFVL